ncbi:hypothetical protein NLU13_5530 [Sarocladium strictum]|uniref:Uncharacterized protein n=1 Tax=Sarocladium strictum TaxID=5046 RepID=A0AA39GH25_SARSR|nr:hypothetical protein NLU13_5530 [Sarocladium strictum]
MIDSLWIDIRSEPEDGRQDLAQGAGGKHRYLSWSNNMNANEYVASLYNECFSLSLSSFSFLLNLTNATSPIRYVTDVALWRSGNAEAYPPQGWSHKSSDINDGRSGDYLYIVWRTKEYKRPKDD